MTNPVPNFIWAGFLVLLFKPLTKYHFNIMVENVSGNLLAAHTASQRPENTSSQANESRPPNVIQDPTNEETNSILDITLSEDEEKALEELRARDQEVRTHENAHKTAGGGYVSAISYDTVTGPDGREYAIGGEAQIDSSPIQGNPEATIRKMDIVIRAALAPAEPSSQDYSVARAAQQARLIAQQELKEQQNLENEQNKPSPQDIESIENSNTEESYVGSDAGSALQNNRPNAEIIQAIKNLIIASRL